MLSMIFCLIGLLSINPVADVSTKEVPKVAISEVEYYEGIPMDFELQTYIQVQSERYDLPYELVYAIIETESGYRPGVVSETNDHGIMQVNAVNHEWVNNELGFELDYLDPYHNTWAGMLVLSDLYKKYYDQSGIHCVLVAYNRGEAGAQKLFSQGVFSTDYSWAVVTTMKDIQEKGTDYQY